MRWELRGMLMWKYWSLMIKQKSTQRTQNYDSAMFDLMNVYSWPGTELDFRRPWLTPIKLCVLPLNSPIRLLYRCISFFFFLSSSALTVFNVLIILPQPLLQFSFSHIRMARPRLRENQFGGRNGGLERLFNLGQTCAVPHSPHSA